MVDPLRARDGHPAVVGGDVMTRPLYEFVRACEVHLADEQSKPLPNNALIAVLADAVRLARETETLYAAQTIEVAPEENRHVSPEDRPSLVREVSEMDSAARMVAVDSGPRETRPHPADLADQILAVMREIRLIVDAVGERVCGEDVAPELRGQPEPFAQFDAGYLSAAETLLRHALDPDDEGLKAYDAADHERRLRKAVTSLATSVAGEAAPPTGWKKPKCPTCGWTLTPARNPDIGAEDLMVCATCLNDQRLAARPPAAPAPQR